MFTRIEKSYTGGRKRGPWNRYKMPKKLFLPRGAKNIR
jgi:hypothetical protein